MKYELSQAKVSSCTPYIFFILFRSVSWLTVSNTGLKSSMIRSTQQSSSIAQCKSPVIFNCEVSALVRDENKVKIKHGFNEELYIWTITAHGHCADRYMNDKSQFSITTQVQTNIVLNKCSTIIYKYTDI